MRLPYRQIEEHMLRTARRKRQEEKIVEIRTLREESEVSVG